MMMPGTTDTGIPGAVTVDAGVCRRPGIARLAAAAVLRTG